MKPLLTPSILAANYANLEADVKAAEKGGADYFYLDASLAASSSEST